MLLAEGFADFTCFSAADGLASGELPVGCVGAFEGAAALGFSAVSLAGFASGFAGAAALSLLGFSVMRVSFFSFSAGVLLSVSRGAWGLGALLDEGSRALLQYAQLKWDRPLLLGSTDLTDQ